MEVKIKKPDDSKSSKSSAKNESKLKETTRKSPKESRWRWLILFSAFVTNIIIDGCLFSFGVIFVHLLDYFNKPRGYIILSGSILDASPMLCGPLASMITNKLGPRRATMLGGVIAFVGFFASTFVSSIEQLFLTFGFIAGFGISIPYLNSIVVVTSYFEGSKTTIAAGISQSGAGFGTLIFAPLYEYLIETYGWRGAIMIISGIVLQALPCGAVFRNIDKQIDLDVDVRSPDHVIADDNLEMVRTKTKLVNGDFDKNQDKIISQSIDRTEIQSNSSTEKLTTRILHILKCKRFLLFLLAQFIVYFWYDVPYNFTIDRLKELGVSTKSGSIVVATIGACHIVGNILFGFLGNRTQVFRFYLYCTSLMIWGINVGIFPLFTDYTSNIILSGTFGLISACQEAIHAAIIIDILGEDKMTDAYGVLMFVEGIGNLIGPPVAGMARDITGSYDLSFMLAGCCIAFAGVMVIVIRLFGSRNSTQKHTDPQHA